jgi:predicted outer membrane repeat protein
LVYVGNLDISNCTTSAVVVNSTATEGWAALLFADLHHNKGHSGGAMRVNNGSLMLDHVDMRHNEATTNGGALYVSLGACITFGKDLGRFMNITTSLPYSASSGTTRAYRFLHNRAASGGAMYLDRPTCKFYALEKVSTIYIGSATFHNNTADKDGGAISISNGKGLSLKELAGRSKVNQATDMALMFADFVDNKVRPRPKHGICQWPCTTAAMVICCRTLAMIYLCTVSM